MRSRTAGKLVDRKAAVARHSVTVTRSLGKDLAERVAGKLLLCFDSNHDLISGNWYTAFSLSHTRNVCISLGCRCNCNSETYLTYL